MSLEILVLQRGWVIVGDVEQDEDDCDFWGVKSSSVVRNWGTTKGIGELAMNGPLKDTKLDPLFGTTKIYKPTVVAQFECDGSKWNKCTCACGSCKCKK